MASAKPGAGWCIKLFVDGEAVGTGSLPVTIPLSLGLCAGICIEPYPRTFPI